MKTEILGLLVLLAPLLAGCSGCNKAATGDDAPDGEAQVETGGGQAIKLDTSLDYLNRLEELTPPDTIRQILDRLDPRYVPPVAEASGQADRLDRLVAAWPESQKQREILDWLNQWIRDEPAAKWKPDPMALAAARQYLGPPDLDDLGSMEFTRFDGYVLQEASWLRDLAHWARGDMLDDLERAKTLFDWTVRNIQLEPDEPGRTAQFPWEVLLFGRGTAMERAWVYLLLLRQLDIDAAVLAVEPEPGTPGAPPAFPAPAAGAQGAAAGKAGAGLRPWCVGVLIAGQIYLFDPRLGLPIPGSHGIGRGRDGQLAIRPATLAEVLADEQLLRQLDFGESYLYPFRAADLKRLVVLLEAVPPSLTRRMLSLQSRLTGQRRMVLSTSPTACARRWKAAAPARPQGVPRAQPAPSFEVRLWTVPFETLRDRARLPWPQVRSRLLALLPFFVPPLLEADRAKTPAPLYCGRVLQLRGKLVPGKAGSQSAMAYYNIARPSNEQLASSAIDELERAVVAVRLEAKLDAGYWSGLINFQRAHDRSADRVANYNAAINWFDDQTLQAFSSLPSNPWTTGAQYNLARTYEALGDIQRAALQYGLDDASPGYHGDLLRAKWLKETAADQKGAQAPK